MGKKKVSSYYIYDFGKEERRKKYIRKLQICDFVARSLLNSVKVAKQNRKFMMANREYWHFGVVPPSAIEINSISKRQIMWYINTHIKVQHPIWNGSLLHGFAQMGKIYHSERGFDRVRVFSRKQFKYLIDISPFSGCLTKLDYRGGMWWHNVPALHLKYDYNSLSFMAGVLATGKEHKHTDGKTYAMYTNRIAVWLRKWGIPIEHAVSEGCVSWVLISPFWPSLLHDYMPKVLRIWRRIPNAGMAHEYAGVMWKVYTGEEFGTNCIPYLKDRWYYSGKYFTPKERLTTTMQRLWIEMGLTGIDERFKNLIREQKTV